jgi:hypothetical protein
VFPQQGEREERSPSSVNVNMADTPPTSDDEGRTEEVSLDDKDHRPAQQGAVTGASRRASASSLRVSREEKAREGSALEESMHQWVFETSQTARLNMVSWNQKCSVVACGPTAPPLTCAMTPKGSLTKVVSRTQLFVPEKVPLDTVGRKDQVLGYQARDKQLEPLAAQMRETKLMAQQLALSCEVTHSVSCPCDPITTTLLTLGEPCSTGKQGAEGQFTNAGAYSKP